MQIPTSVAATGDVWWHVDGAPTPEEWSALFAGGTLLVAFVAAVFALVQLRAFYNAQWDQARPYLVVDFAFQSHLMLVEVKNISRTAAAGVTLRVDPPFVSSINDDAAMLNEIFSPGWQIELLAPDRNIRHTLDSAISYAQHPEFPQEYRATVQYRDSNERSRWRWQRGIPRKRVVEYTETFRLSFKQWSLSSIETDHLASTADQLQGINTAIKSIAKAKVLRPPSLFTPPSSWKNTTVKAWIERNRA